MSARAQPGSKEIEAIRQGDRQAMAKTITLLESKRPEKAEQGRTILEALVPHTGQSMRVGVTGPPGVGKSSFIESLGIYLLERGHRVAVRSVGLAAQFKVQRRADAGRDGPLDRLGIEQTDECLLNAAFHEGL